METKNYSAKDKESLMRLIKEAAKENNLLVVKGKLFGDPLAMGLYCVNGKLVWLNIDAVRREQENKEDEEERI